MQVSAGLASRGGGKADRTAPNLGCARWMQRWLVGCCSAAAAAALVLAWRRRTAALRRLLRVPYDEFSMFQENAQEHGIPYEQPPKVCRKAVALPDNRKISALVWGAAAPQIVLLHGGAQNAHTWDTVALALGLPLVAIDLPGHGHSDDAAAAMADPVSAAADVAHAIDALAPSAAIVVGMSFGGLTAIVLSQQRPDLVRRLVLVDVTPGVTRAKAAHIFDFIKGPASFDSMDAMLARTVRYNPTRSQASLRRGLLHNARQREDGSWVWRHARSCAFDEAEEPAAVSRKLSPTTPRSTTPRSSGVEEGAGGEEYDAMWEAVGALKAPCLLVRGMRSSSVVDDADEAELCARLPTARVERLDAGHSVQGDAPVALAEAIAAFRVTPTCRPREMHAAAAAAAGMTAAAAADARAAHAHAVSSGHASPVEPAAGLRVSR